MAASSAFPLKICKSPDADAALANVACVNPGDFAAIKAAAKALPQIGGRTSTFVELVCPKARNRPLVFRIKSHEAISAGQIGLSTIQRKSADVTNGDACTVTPFSPETEAIYAVALQFAISFYKKAEAHQAGVIDTDYVHEHVLSLVEGQFFTLGQEILIEYRGINLVLKVASILAGELGALDGTAVHGDVPLEERGILHASTDVTFCSGATDIPMNLSGNATAAPSLFKADWSFENLGIGGLDKEFGVFFRRAFTSRVFPPSVIKKLGIKHVKGILLYGPPGTGKTLMARQIGKMLNAKEPIVINGPEVFDKYVGGSEAKVREAFAPAEADQARFGDASPLHIIIFDELDAIAKTRGSRSGDTGAGDQVVNQLLSKMDGVNALDNVLIIGMTNRKDMIDEAMLRPGRLEVHLEIHLPDEFGRLQIFTIHTKALRESSALASDVELAELAAMTKNYTGSEISGVVKSATSFAMTRHVDVKGGSATEKDASNIVVTRDDFMSALEEVRPALGQDEEDFSQIMANGIIAYSSSFVSMMAQSDLIVKQIKNSDRTNLLNILISGVPGSGKSAVAVKIAQDSEIPFIRVLSADMFVALSELNRCDRIVRTFLDAYKSRVSVIVLDDIERIVDWVALGARFSNPALQTLVAYMKKPPPPGHKLLVLATTSCADALAQIGLNPCFNFMLQVPVLTSGDEVRNVLRALDALDEPGRAVIAESFAGTVPIKKLIMLTEMAMQSHEPTETLADTLMASDMDGVTRLNTM